MSEETVREEEVRGDHGAGSAPCGSSGELQILEQRAPASDLCGTDWEEGGLSGEGRAPSVALCPFPSPGTLLARSVFVHILASYFIERHGEATKDVSASSASGHLAGEIPPAQHLPRASVSRTWRDITPRNQPQPKLRKQHLCRLEIMSILKIVVVAKAEEG